MIKKLQVVSFTLIPCFLTDHIYLPDSSKFFLLQHHRFWEKTCKLRVNLLMNRTSQQVSWYFAEFVRAVAGICRPAKFPESFLTVQL
jgi:hypothetical protein